MSMKASTKSSNNTRIIRIIAQTAVSIALIVLLMRIAMKGNLSATFGLIRPRILLLAAGLYLAACSLNARRWQLLLRYLGINESLSRLNSLYFIGNFCSLFLPTSAGGDAYRIYEVARHRRSPLRVLLATLQERLTGLGVTVGVGLAVTLFYRDLFPDSLLWPVILVQSAGVLGVLILLYPGPFLNLARRAFLARVNPPVIQQLVRTSAVARVATFLRPLRESPPMTFSQVVPVLVLALVTFLLVALMYQVVGRSLGIDLSIPAFCLVVALVWVVRMLPVSLNGIGVGEGASVYLTGLFGVAADKGLALALTVLGIQTAIALLGGLLLVFRTLRASWGPGGAQSSQQPSSSSDRGEAEIRPAA